MKQESAFNAEFAEKNLENAENLECDFDHPKGMQRYSLCVLCGSARSALKEL